MQKEVQQAVLSEMQQTEPATLMEAKQIKQLTLAKTHQPEQPILAETYQLEQSVLRETHNPEPAASQGTRNTQPEEEQPSAICAYKDTLFRMIFKDNPVRVYLLCGTGKAVQRRNAYAGCCEQGSGGLYQRGYFSRFSAEE